jgi:Uma2 family endonuclease
MDIYMPMSTTKRHNKITGTLFSETIDMLRKNEVNALQEECALVYWGTKKNSNGFDLVDATKIVDKSDFTENIILELEYVQPDFVLFKNNLFIENKRQTRTAGQPDLIVEVWSESNLKNDRAFLQNLYATSDITEHWYIEQDLNKVECYMGRKQLPEQSLKNILKTQKGLEFDLRYLAI